MRREGTVQRLDGASRAILAAALVGGCGMGGASASPIALEAGFPDAGTYTTTTFQPRLTMRLEDDRWQVLFPDDEDEFAIEDDSGTGEIFYGARVSQVANPDRGVGEAPDDLVSWLGSYPGLMAGPPVATTVDSLPATSIDITNETGGDKDLFAFPTGNFHIPPGVRLRFTIVPMDGPDLAIYTGGPVAGFDAAIARTQPMLDSLLIGD